MCSQPENAIKISFYKNMLLVYIHHILNWENLNRFNMDWVSFVLTALIEFFLVSEMFAFWSILF